MTHDLPGDVVPHRAASEPSERSKNTSRVFWQLMMKVCLVAALTHAVFGVLFYALGAWMLAWVNVGSVTLFLASYGLIRQRRNQMAVVLVFVEIFGHAALAVHMIGWDSGFHYYLLLVAPVVIMSNLSKTSHKLLMTSSVCAFYMLLDATVRASAPLHTLHPGVLNALRYFNILVTFGLLTYLAMLYLGMIKKAEKQLLVMASTDPLTKLNNRRRVTEIIEYEITRSKRMPRTLCFVLGDIDHFKAINDRHGHEGGDQVLIEVSQALRAAVREQDSVGRWGGEEFLVVLPNTELDGAELVAERIRNALGEMQVMAGGEAVAVTMTLGLSSCREGENMEAAIARADEALYRGKAAGRNRLELEQRGV
ncbi:GGDEF domain-containing protein [Aquabacterium sp.]|uniref:GGDEF domain-containing protein n=1 Tax=Aquabacterium sp. TaxID=1872578 RepID=UPI0035AF8785